MSRKFYAINRETGERWRPDPNAKKQFLVMYDSGYLAEVEFIPRNGYNITPLDPKIWEKVVREAE